MGGNTFYSGRLLALRGERNTPAPGVDDCSLSVLPCSFFALGCLLYKTEPSSTKVIYIVQRSMEPEPFKPVTKDCIEIRRNIDSFAEFWGFVWVLL